MTALKLQTHKENLHMKDPRLADEHASTFLSDIVRNYIRLNGGFLIQTQTACYRTQQNQNHMLIQRNRSHGE